MRLATCERPDILALSETQVKTDQDWSKKPDHHLVLFTRLDGEGFHCCINQSQYMKYIPLYNRTAVMAWLSESCNVCTLCLD